MSLWKEYKSAFSFPKLKEDIQVDTLIIGGGITGMTTLYYLKDNISACLVDSNHIGEGVTANTTGKLTYLQGAIYSKLSKNINPFVAESYLKSQKDAISFAKEIIEKNNISCHLEKVKSYSLAIKEKDVKALKEEKNFLEKQNIKVEENTLCSQNYKYAIGVEDTYVFNPMEYINGLKEILKEKQIYEQTKITKIELNHNQYICYTKNATITCKNVIVACHYPFFTIPFFLPLKSHIEKSYIIACKYDKNDKYSCITVSNPGFSVRFYEDGKNIYKMCLGKSHVTAINQDDKENFQKVKQLFSIKEADIVKEWSNIDIITDDFLPYIGLMKKNFYMATGFNTWGMTNGILAGKIISELLLCGKSNYQDLFSLHRINKYKIKSFFANTAISMKAMLGSKLTHKNWYPSSLKFIHENGKSVAIYTDKDKKEHKVFTTCPHLGCSLIFNENELTWDCPCHSSRFDLDGKCIKGPSLYDISCKK